MIKLPEDLTPELLGLVLGKKIIVGEYEANTDMLGESFSTKFEALLTIIQHKVRYTAYTDNVYREEGVNIDTLTRLMKEWIFDQGYEYGTGKIEGGRYWCVIDRGDWQYYEEESEFEAVLKATHWVSKTKGLI